MLQRGATTRLWSVIAFLRPQIALQASIYVCIGIHLSGASLALLDAHAFVSLLLVMLIVSFGFVVNDFCDLEIDRRAKPDRFIPSGRVSSSEARLIGVIIAGLVVVLAQWVRVPLRLFVWFNLLLTTAYSFWLKQTVFLGNLAIAVLNSSVLLFGALVGSGLNNLVWSIAGTTLAYSLAQELLYTVDDRTGDARAGIVTTAIYLGSAPTLALARSILIIAAASTFVPYWLGYGGAAYLGLLVLCTFAPIFLQIVPLTLRGADADIHQACRWAKIVRIFAIVPLLALSTPK